MHLRSRFLICTILAGAAAASGTAGLASSHREAPAIAGMPRVDSTDFYLFRSYAPGRDGFVTIIANYLPLQDPYGGPNYFTLDNDAIYEIHIDNTGDAVEDVTFQFDFSTSLAGGTGVQLPVGDATVAIPLRQAGSIESGDTANLNERESYTLTMISGDRRTGSRNSLSPTGGGGFVKPVDNIGNKTLPDYEDYANDYIYPVNFGACGTGNVFVGQRAEAFAVNLGEVFDLVNLVPIQGASNPAWPQYDVAQPFEGGIVQDRANDELIGEKNVTSLALEVPTACLTGNGNGVIGGWTTASLPQAQLRDPSPTYNGTTRQGGAYVQVSRLGMPLVNELVIGLRDKDLFSAAEPTQDGALAVYVTNPTLPALLNLLFNSPTPPGSTDPADYPFGVTNIAPSNFPRNDLVTAFLTGFPGVNQLPTPAGASGPRGAEMTRLNTALPITPRDQQNTFGLVAEDLGGFPNGRRPGDDTVDIALRVVMGALCHDLPLATELAIDGAVEDTETDNVNLLLCGADAEASRDAAPAGTVAFTDGAPLRATELQNAFPYLNSPIPGSPNNTN